METFGMYLLKSTVCLTLFYVSYLLLFRKESGLKYVRLYLLSTVILSLLLPLNHYSIDIFPQLEQKSDQPQVENITNIEESNIYTSKPLTKSEVQESKQITPIVYLQIVKWTYFTVLAGILISFIIGIINILRIYIHSKKETIDNTTVLMNEKLNHPFSFMNIIFINPGDLDEKELKSIIAHENIHVSQYHFIDLVLIELVAAVMWFNPFVWYLRKSLRQVHEYLADEGVLNIGFDRLEYQALLINQVAESRLLSLASGFNQSLIKKRIIMMTKLKSDNTTKVKLLVLVPVAFLLLMGVSCMNGQYKVNADGTGLEIPPPPPPPPPPPIPSNDSVIWTNAFTAVSLTKMNVLYIGVDNPVEIAVSGYKTKDYEIKIDNGSIHGSNGIYIVNVTKKPMATIAVSVKGQEVAKAMFRVKTVPDPVAKIAGMKGGSIKKSDLLAQRGPYADMENFDFDLSFKVTNFKVTAIFAGKEIVKSSETGRFSDEQFEIIKRCDIGQKVYIEDILAIGPDGTKRNLGTLAFTLE